MAISVFLIVSIVAAPTMAQDNKQQFGTNDLIPEGYTSQEWDKANKAYEEEILKKVPDLFTRAHKQINDKMSVMAPLSYTPVYINTDWESYSGNAGYKSSFGDGGTYRSNYSGTWADAYSMSVSYPSANGAAAAWTGNAIQVYGSGTGYADVCFDVDYGYILETGIIAGVDMSGVDIIFSVWDYTTNSEVASQAYTHHVTWAPLFGYDRSGNLNDTLQNVPFTAGHQYALRMEMNATSYKGSPEGHGLAKAMNNLYNGASGRDGLDYNYITIVW